MKNFKNSVYLTGLAGGDPIVINFSEGKKVARVSLAINEFYKNHTGLPICETQWFNLVFWNKRAELAEKLVKKGIGISIEGTLKVQSYTDKAGDQRSSTEVFVNHLELVEPTEE